MENKELELKDLKSLPEKWDGTLIQWRYTTNEEWEDIEKDIDYELTTIGDSWRVYRIKSEPIDTSPELTIGDKVIKNEETWEKSDFDNWGRGKGIGEVIDIDEDGMLDVRWPDGKCYEKQDQVIKYTWDLSNLRIDYISDLHLDFWVKEVNPQSPKFQKSLNHFIDMIQPKPGKVLILGGDQGHYFSQDSTLLLELKKYYQNILIVPGNHDMYLVSHNQQKKYRWDSFERLLEMKRFCDKTNGLYFMDGNVIVIDGFRIGGIGMWHDWSYGKELGYSATEMEDIWKQAMNDANLIFKDSKKNYTISFGYNGEEKIVHFKPMELYKKYREKLDNMEPCHLMFSHYGPIIPDDIEEDYKEDEVTSFYYFDGSSDIFRLKPQYWIHGHTHTKYESNRSGTKVITNPLGYPSENSYTTIQSIYLK